MKKSIRNALAAGAAVALSGTPFEFDSDGDDFDLRLLRSWRPGTTPAR
jgi:hypothetical protein